MDQISQYLLLGFEGDLFITLGLGSGTTTTDACSMWPRGMWPDGMWPDTCPVAPVGGGGQKKKKKRKQVTLKFSDFAGREEYEKALREKISQAGLVAKKFPVSLEDIELAAQKQEKQLQQTDAQIAVSDQVLMQLRQIRDDEDALKLMLMMIALK